MALRIATRSSDAHGLREVDRVLDDVDLVLQCRRDIHRGVGDDQRIGMAGHIHDEAMADAPGGADAPSRDTTAPMISSVWRLPFIRASARPRGTSSTARAAEAWLCSVLTSSTSQLEADALCDAPDPLDGAHENWLDQSEALASSAPRNETSSHGCATATLIGGPFCAAAMRRSYFSWRDETELPSVAYGPTCCPLCAGKPRAKILYARTTALAFRSGAPRAARISGSVPFSGRGSSTEFGSRARRSKCWPG